MSRRHRPTEVVIEEQEQPPTGPSLLRVAYLRDATDATALHWLIESGQPFSYGGHLSMLHPVRGIEELEATVAEWVRRGGEVEVFARSTWDASYPPELGAEIDARGTSRHHRGLPRGPYHDNSRALLQLGLGRHLASKVRPALSPLLTLPEEGLAGVPESATARALRISAEAALNAGAAARAAAFKARHEQQRADIARMLALIAEGAGGDGQYPRLVSSDPSAFTWYAPMRATETPAQDGRVVLSKRCALTHIAHPDKPVWSGSIVVDSHEAFPTPADAISLLEAAQRSRHARP